MSIFDVLILCGLVAQVVAGFILSVEVIGLDRVARWISLLSLLRSDLVEEAKGSRVSNRGRRIAGIICGICAMVGVLISVRFSMRYYIDPQQMNFNQRTYVSLIGALAGGILGVLVQQAIAYGLTVAVAALRNLESQTRARSSGIIGFLLLFLGFLLQFGGTLGQSLSK